MSTQRLGFADAARGLVARDLRLALRRSGDTLQPLGFFLVVTTLFPLALDPELSRLRDIAPAALWVGALLSSLLALDRLFREDAQDGTLEQLALSGWPFAGLLLAKTAVHWLMTGLPLVVIAPLAATALGAPYAAMPGILASLLLGTVALSLIGIVSGIIVLHGLVGARKLEGWTALFLATTALTSVTAFFFPSASFGPPQVIGVISLAVLAAAIVALYVFRLAGPWRWIFIVGAVLALYLNVFVAVVRAFQKLPPLAALAPTQSEPPFLIAQLVVMAIFIVLGVVAVKRFHA